MKLASFQLHGRETWGVVERDYIADVGTTHGSRFPDLRALIAAGAYGQAQEAAVNATRVPLAAVTWLPVVSNPQKIFCIGLNYDEHRKETGRAEVAHPTVFARFANSQTGHLCDVPLTHLSSQLDYEGEFAVIIGKRGRYVSASDALTHIAGYACYNDFTVRDWQHHTHQFTPGKNFPRTGAFGPWMVTPDEIADLDSLHLQTRVNGETVQTARLGQMIFGIAELIAYCSSFTQLEAGDVIVSGTPGGVGAKRQPPRWLQPGDLTEVEIDGIGLLRNRIVREAHDAAA